MDVKYPSNLKTPIMIKKISIAIAEDHPYFSKGVANTLELSNRYTITGFLEKSAEIIAHIKMHQTEILILDINLSGTNTLKLLPEIKKQNHNIKILILSMYLPNEVDYNSSAQYIDSYVLKNSGAEILSTALEHIIKGEKYTDPNVDSILNLNTDNFVNKIKLSSREIEILELLKQGFSNKVISEKLFISELTVKTHRKNIMQKMGVSNIVQLLKKS
jgi:DNA-binding NarL/FixJ family response regulator